MIQLGKFVGGGGGVVSDTNYLYPARWGWIKNANGNKESEYKAFKKDFPRTLSNPTHYIILTLYSTIQFYVL